MLFSDSSALVKGKEKRKHVFTGNHYKKCDESSVACWKCLCIINRLLPLLCCGLTWERLNIRRKSFFSSSSGVLSICSAEYGVVKGAMSVEGEGAFLLPCTAGGETLRSLIILLLFLLFRARSSLRWASVVRPHTRRKSTFFGEIHLGRWIWLGQKMKPLYGHVSVFVYLWGCVQFEWRLLCHPPQMGFHVLLITLIIWLVQVVVIT